MLFQKALCCFSLTCSVVAGAVLRDSDPSKSEQIIAERQVPSSTKVPDSACTNGPNTRACWSDGFSIATDFDAKAPPAGKTVTYDLEITNTTLNPDGHGERSVMLVNGVFPGPVLRASWGDTLVVNVKNSLENNGTGIHWHGVRQLNSCQHDGVPGVTECPIAPGKSRQYVFKCTQFGTTWYHSHWSAQYSEGTLGTLIIDGPATSNYDEDLGTLPLTEWYYTDGFTLNERALHSQTGPPKPDNILVNGTHKNADGGGSYFKMTVKKGKKYRLRLINTAVDTVFHVSMDGHPFTVMTSDFVPIRPYVADQLVMNIGQRYDVVINANQSAGNYWLRVGIGSCSSNDILDGNGNPKIPLGAILHYDGQPDAQPTSTGVTLKTTCEDETNIVPYVPNTVPQSVVAAAGELDLDSHQTAENDYLFTWLIDGSTAIMDWEKPSLQLALDGVSASEIGNNSNVHETATANQWYLWWIQTKTPIAIPHPIHLHGHDFYVLKSGAGTWDGTTNGLNFNNPPRRDTATLPAGGYLLLAFPADNPGVWLMHCHIAWHASQGLAVQFLEQEGVIKQSIGNVDGLNQGCEEWNEYWEPGKHIFNQTDSGI